MRDLPLALRLGRSLDPLLDAMAVPVRAGDQVPGRMLGEVAGIEEAATLRARAEDRLVPAWLRDVGRCCFAWNRLLRLVRPGLEEIIGRQSFGPRGA